MKRFFSILWPLCYLCCCLSLLPAAIIQIPSLTMITRGLMENGKLVLGTQGEMDMLIQGGDKFGGQIVLGFFSEDLETGLENGLEGLAFKSASVSVRNIFASPLVISYFVGLQDHFCSGEGFSEIFGIAPVTTSYSGFMYFPDGTVFNGIHAVNGTGLQLGLVPINNLFYASLYFYQDAYLEEGEYSYDLRTLFNFSKINLEFFAGGSFNLGYAPYGIYRTGLLFNAQVPTGDIIMQLGMPYLNPADFTLGMELFYILFEVNVKLGIVQIIPTVFIHPGFYLQEEIPDAGALDINLNLKIGELQKHLACGGLESNISFTDMTIEGLVCKVSPYLTLVSPGVEWQFKINTTVFPWPELDEMFEGFIGVKAVF